MKISPEVDWITPAKNRSSGSLSEARFRMVRSPSDLHLDARAGVADVHGIAKGGGESCIRAFHRQCARGDNLPSHLHHHAAHAVRVAVRREQHVARGRREALIDDNVPGSVERRGAGNRQGRIDDDVQSTMPGR